MGYYGKLSVELLGDRNRAEVLRFLYRNRHDRFSQREMSNALGIPPATISRTCKKLVNLNIVDHFSIGKTILYHFDEKSYIAKKILVPIFKNEENFFYDLIKDILKTLKPGIAKCIKEIVLFGSIVRGEDTPASDVDLAIIIACEVSPLQTRMLADDEMKDIEEHFVNESVNRKIYLDIHIFIEGETRENEKGVSLASIYDEGTIVWRQESEKSSKGRL